MKKSKISKSLLEIWEIKEKAYQFKTDLPFNLKRIWWSVAAGFCTF